MDKRTAGVNDERSKPADPAVEAERLEEKVEAIRANLGGLVGELDRRRHRLTAAGKRVLPYAAGVAGAAALAMVGALIWRRRNQPSRGRQMLAALRRISAHPDRVGKSEPLVIKKILAASGAAAASMLIRRLMERPAIGRAAARPPERARRQPIGLFAPLLAQRTPPGGERT
jgi:hypothetical protein